MAALPVTKQASEIAPKADKANKKKFLGRYHTLPRKLSDDYMLSDRVLGSGFSGDVRLGFAHGTGQKVAIKTLDMSHATPVVWAKMQSELEVSLSVDHPHIVRLINVYEAEESFSLVMEHLEGGTLSSWMVEGVGYEEADAAHISKQMLLAISYLHNHGIVHRDLKPENFVYEDESRKMLKLIDFGFSKFRHDQTLLLSRCGSPAYAAPEVFTGIGYTNQCDLWSLGVIIFTLLVGYLPSGKKDTEKMNRMRASCLQMSDGARSFTKSMMQREPGVRITANEALQHSWLREHGQHYSIEADAKLDVHVVTSLQSYGQTDKLRRHFLSAVAKTISDEKVSQLRDQFVNVDTNLGDKNSNGMGSALIKAGTPACDVKGILQAIDADDDGKIEFSEFMAAALSATPDFSDDSLQLAFRNFDVDRMGRITSENLRQVLGDSFHESSIARDGLDFTEFCAYMREPVQKFPAPIHGCLKKLRGSSNRDPKKSSHIGFRDKLAYHERYVVVSGLQVRWWSREQSSEDGDAHRTVSFLDNDCEVAAVPQTTTRFLLRIKTGTWQGETLTDVDNRDFVFDAAGSEHSCQQWMDAMHAHIEFAKSNGSDDVHCD